ncbi:hypothetical protein ACTXT7_007077 [Hymenolepis weldensis]
MLKKIAVFHCGKATEVVNECPGAVTTEVCRNGKRFLITKSYTKNAEGICKKSFSQQELPGLICPPPTLLKASPCSTEGQMTEVYEVHEKRDCKCEKLIKSLQKACLFIEFRDDLLAEEFGRKKKASGLDEENPDCEEQVK